MFEGSATSRKSQIFSGITLGILGLPFLFFGLFSALKMTEGFPKLAFIILTAFSLTLGVLSVLMSYRLITAQGVKKGGGLLAPLTYKVLGYFFIGLSLLFITFTVSSHDFRGLVGAGCGGFISYWCFVASRHRGAMRNLPEWK